MSLLLQNLTIRPESIQSLYASYLSGGFLVNRRYQRKLVWTIEEKRAFVDSVRRGFPVPLFLFAEQEFDGRQVLEVIDGMQRLNAVFSFLEGEFETSEGSFFDLETIPETKRQKKKGALQQKTPALAADECSKIVTYQVPLSIARNKSEDEIDEVFRRINSYGKHLSRQELRQAGSTSNFAQLVRRISVRIRGDSSASDRLNLSQMKGISITNRELPYGLDVSKLFWVENKVLTPDQVRESRDEELIADMLGFILLKPRPASTSAVLDDYYGFFRTDQGKARGQEVEQAVQKHGEEAIVARFLKVHDELRGVIARAEQPFNLLMFKEAGIRVPRYYQVVFLALYGLVIEDGMRISAPVKLVSLLDGIGAKIKVTEGGQWSSTERENHVNAVKGIIQPAFKKAKSTDPALDSWVTEFENVLTQSEIENNLYDFKQGLHSLQKPYPYDPAVVPQIAKTLSAMANHGPGASGYVVIGLTDDPKTAARIKSEHKLNSVKYRKFHIFGIDHEISLGKYAKGLDTYFQRVLQELQNQPVTEKYKKQILKDARVFSYFDRHLLLLQVIALDEPCAFDGKYYQRSGSHNDEIQGEAIKGLFKRFY